MAKNLGAFIFLARAPCSGSISVYIAKLAILAAGHRTLYKNSNRI